MGDKVASTENDTVPDYIVTGVSHLVGKDIATSQFQAVKSAQQQVWIVENVPSNNHILPVWKSALECGKLVVRSWKGGACWWNLNRTASLMEMATSEVAGYRLAHKALDQIHIPVVLHFSLDNDDKTTNPWAVLSYVGADSKRDSGWTVDRSWVDGMVQSRMEFGLEEPHPRWGRVPADRACDYALSILHNAIIPLHKFMVQHHQDPQLDMDDDLKALRKPGIGDDKSTTTTPIGFTYASMVQLYQKEHSNMMKQQSAKDPRLLQALDTLQGEIEWLQQQQPYSEEPLQPLVLCHMDCQPQNLIFVSTRCNQQQVLWSVLDWEEAALADRRFELLLLGRKVCANVDQAKVIWNAYQQQQALLLDNNPQGLGPLQPWLMLETVHSITTLLLQSMDIGGRSPWESKPELWDKLQREFQRLDMYHCNGS